MDYFCYISRSKVDQLYQTIVNAEDVDEWTEQQITENNFNSALDVGFSVANILNLFKSGITYGRSGTIQREKKIKMSYVEKLRKVLTSINKQEKIISFNDAMKKSDFKALFYIYQGEFKVDPSIKGDAKSDFVATIKSQIEDTTIALDCSLRYFSEGNEPDGSFLLHSGNSKFFHGDLELNFETIFVLLGEKEKTFFGTPLFLKLTPTRMGTTPVSI